MHRFVSLFDPFLFAFLSLGPSTMSHLNAAFPAVPPPGFRELSLPIQFPTLSSLSSTSPPQLLPASVEAGWPQHVPGGSSDADALPFQS